MKDSTLTLEKAPKIKPVSLTMAEKKGQVVIDFGACVDLVAMTPEKAHEVAFALTSIATRMQSRN